MKRIIFSMLAIATMASCSSEEVLNQDSKTPVAVKMKADVLQTKAPVNGLTEAITDVAFARFDKTLPADWAGATPTKVEGVTIAQTSGEITFSPEQHYLTDGGTSYFVGYMPSASSTLANNKVSWTGIDGTQDIMYAEYVDGSKTTQGPLAPKFTHKLTQIKFTVKGGDGFEAGKKLKSITINDVELPASMELSSGAVTYASPANLPIPIATPIVIETTPASVGVPVMFKAGASSLSIKVTITNAAGDTDQEFDPISVPVTTAVSTAHTISLEFKAKDVTGKATVDEWIEDSSNHPGEII